MANKKIDWKKLAVCIIIALLSGGIGAILGGNMSEFAQVEKPSFAPPGWLFPVVWTILYILMGISSYMVCNFKKLNTACKFYIAQLVFNVLWSMFFFRYQLYLFSFVWLLILIFLIISMIIAMYKEKPLAAYLQIPYLLWCTFAAILNFTIYMLNG